MEHDPLCPWLTWPEHNMSCRCDLVAMVRADTAERIAQAIEAASGEWSREYGRISREQQAPLQVGPGTVTAAYGDAAHIARSDSRPVDSEHGASDG